MSPLSKLESNWGPSDTELHGLIVSEGRQQTKARKAKPMTDQDLN